MPFRARTALTKRQRRVLAAAAKVWRRVSSPEHVPPASRKRLVRRGRKVIFRGYGDKYRGLGAYSRDLGVDIPRLVDQQWRKQNILNASKPNQPIGVLDIGGGAGRFAKELEEKMPKKVQVTTTSITDHNIFGLKRYKTCAAEHLPKQWAGKFPVIVSRAALQYCIYPDVALAEIFRALSPWGKAYLDVSSAGARIADIKVLETASGGSHFSQMVGDVYKFANAIGLSFPQRITALQNHLIRTGHRFVFQIEKGRSGSPSTLIISKFDR